jgi:hypothetical protein
MTNAMPASLAPDVSRAHHLLALISAMYKPI